MKKYSILTILLLSLLIFSCEKVVDVDLKSGEPKLVVEASINWLEDTDGSEQQIKLSTTTGYFSNSIPAVSGATVFITDTNDNVFEFLEESDAGIYKCYNFIPVLNQSYQLTIIYNGETYTATEKLLNTPTIKRIEQKSDGGIFGDAIELKFFFDDLPNQENHYFLKINDPYKVIPEYGVLEDRFFQNNEMFSIYFSEDFKSGDVVTFTLNGISRNYYNYMNILLAQTGTSSAGPFSTPTATIRGNVINQTNFNNFALGYFRLSKTQTENYTIQ
jgi:hypothetical protein